MSTPDQSSPRAVAAVRAHPWWTAFAVLVIALIVLALLWDWNWFKGVVESRVKAQTGRELHIDGDLDVDLGRVATIRADGLRFANADWAKTPTMASVGRLELKIELLPLFGGNVRIPSIRLTKPDLQLETGPKGVGNWAFGNDDPPSDNPARIQQLWVDGGQLRYLDAPGRTDVKLKIASVKATSGNAAPPIGMDGGGRWAGNAFTLKGTAQSPLDLQSTDTPYKVDLRAVAGATKAHLSGGVVNPLQVRGFDLQFALSGSNLADLYPLVGVALPLTPPYALDGHLGHHGNTWSYRDFTGKVGDSDLGGAARVTLGGARPKLDAQLVSKVLDFNDLAGFIGGAPTSDGKEGTNAETKAIAAKAAASPRVLPDTPYELDKLRSMDANVTLKARRINSPSLPLDNMDAHLFLDDGVLRLDPLNFGIAGGDVRATIRMNARQSAIHTKADIVLDKLDLAKLLPDAKLTEGAVGKIGGHLLLDGDGNSMAKMFGSADGSIAVGMGKGQVSNLLIELAGLDVYESLKYLIGKDRQVPLRCAFADFSVKQGLMTARALAVDTTDTLIVGDGTINLADESLKLTLKPRPKDRTIFALRSPLQVGGTFKDPSFRPDLVRVGLRGAIALVLGSIVPPAALLATIDLGDGPEQVDCGGKYAK